MEKIYKMAEKWKRKLRKKPAEDGGKLQNGKQ